MQDVRTDVVEEVGVVGDHHHRVRVYGGEVVVQPQHCVQVQVVRRLVEHQQLGLQEQGLRQTDAHAPASGELDHGPVHGEAVLVRRVRIEAQAAEDLPDAALGRLRAGGLEVGGGQLELVARGRQLLDGDLLASLHPLLVVLHLVRQLLFPLDQVGHLLVGGDDLLDRGAVARLRLLLHEDDVPVQRHRHLARGDVPHDRGLALTVRAQDAVALALHEGDRGVVEERLPRAREREIVADKGIARGRRVVASLHRKPEDAEGTDELLVVLVVHHLRLFVLLVDPPLLVRKLLALLHLLQDGLQDLLLRRLRLCRGLRGGGGGLARAPGCCLLLLTLHPRLVILHLCAPWLSLEVGHYEAEDDVEARRRSRHLRLADRLVTVVLALNQHQVGDAFHLRKRHLVLVDLLPASEVGLIVVGHLAYAHVHGGRPRERELDAPLVPRAPEEDEALHGLEVA
mmetsp:Transcript_52694/g.136013  ORF Transcript_52694/g.136013 Transcript_52694/m.136013 type:complete len:455 (-) Transcript_52694:596-1960(-)